MSDNLNLGFTPAPNPEETPATPTTYAEAAPQPEPVRSVRNEAPKNPYNQIVEDIDLSQMVKMTPDMVYEEERKKMVKGKLQEQDDLLALMDGALKNEEARVEQVDDDPEMQEVIMDAKKASGKYTYVEAKRETPAARIFETSEYSTDYLDDDDEEEEEEIKPEASSADDDEEEGPDRDAIELGHQLMRLPVVDYKPDPANRHASVKKERKFSSETVKSSRFKEVGDQAFNNELAKMRKKNYRTVQVPLVNSGFWADMIGTGATDLIMLYSNADQGMTAVDYELERMRATIAGVVGTTPKVPMENLRNRIHSTDYQLLAFGRVCATFSEISSVASCTECGGELRYKVNPLDLLLNADEMRERINRMREVSNAEELSLLKTETKFSFESTGITIILGHPTYIDTVTQYNSVRHYNDPQTGLSKVELARMRRLMSILTMIRSIILPSGTRTSNIYQNYKALCMLDDDDFNEVRDAAAKMYKQIIVPRFGIKDLICPHCGKKITIPLGNQIDDVVFMHSTVMQSMKMATDSDRKNG